MEDTEIQVASPLLANLAPQDSASHRLLGAGPSDTASTASRLSRSRSRAPAAARAAARVLYLDVPGLSGCAPAGAPYLDLFGSIWIYLDLSGHAHACPI